MAECLFCKIVAGELPSSRIHEDERSIAIMDIAPATRGHALVIPRRHSAGIGDIADCAIVAKRIAGMAVDRLGATGVSIMQSNGADAWQTVFHYHVHVIPRYPDDPLKLPWEPAVGDLDEIVHISQTYLSD
jgi:histidine triad (HIT) family protein